MGKKIVTLSDCSLKKSKYFCYLFITIIVLFFCLSYCSTVYAEEEIIDSGQCGENAYWKLTVDGELIIYGEGEMYSFDTYKHSCLYSYAANATKINKVTIQNGISTIGYCCFNSFKNLENITIPNSVLTIGDSAFFDCEKLKTVSIPDSVISIERFAFAGCRTLDNIIVPNSISQLSSGLFMSCTNLSSINLPDNLKNIGEDAFNRCNSLTSISIPDNVTYIGQNAFNGCDSLTSINIPDNVTYIGQNAFRQCYYLTNVNMSESLQNTIKGKEKEYFDLTQWILGKVEIKGNVGDNIYWELKNDNTLYLTGSGEMDFFENYNDSGPWNSYAPLIYGIHIDDKITSIQQNSFMYCYNLKNIYFSKGMDIIPYAAFMGCTSLETIIIPENISQIRDSAFFDCVNLTNVYILSYNLHTFSALYEDTDTIMNIYYPEDCERYQQWEFDDYEKRNHIPYKCVVTHKSSIDQTEHFGVYYAKNIIESGCEKEGYSGDIYCSGCGEFIENGTATPPRGHVWDSRYNITKKATEFEDGEKTYYCKYCKKTKIEKYSLDPNSKNNSKPQNTTSQQQNNENTTSNKTKEQSTTQNGSTHQDSKKTEEKSTIKDTDGNEYYISEKLSEEKLKKNLLVADKKTAGKYKVTKILKKKGKIVGGTVAYIKPYSKNCTTATIKPTVKFAGITFQVTSITNNSFKGCMKLKKVVIGKNVTQIGKNAFNDCKRLKTITIQSSSIKKIGSNAFKGINAKAKIKVPSKMLTKYIKLINKANVPKTVKITK